MGDTNYKLRYLPLFYRDLEGKIAYIAETLQNPQAANDLLDDDMIFAVKFRHNLPDHGGCQFQFRFFFFGCFCDILIRGRIRPERKYYVTKIICFFQERNRFVNCSDPGASFYVLGQTG